MVEEVMMGVVEEEEEKEEEGKEVVEEVVEVEVGWDLEEGQTEPPDLQL